MLEKYKGLFAWEKGRLCMCWHQTSVKTHSVMVCVCVMPHTDTPLLLFTAHSYGSHLHLNHKLVLSPTRGKKMLTAHKWLSPRGLQCTKNVTATAGYYFYSFKQIMLTSKTADSSSLPHIHPHTDTRTVQKLSPPTNRTAKPTKPILEKSASWMSESNLSGCK